ncbi:hypothetical protein ABH982_004143 [Bradyrhizobium ottawaense]
MRPSAASAWMDLVPEVTPRLRIDAGGRLVQQQQFRTGQRAGTQRQPLLPAAGKLARKLLLASREPEPLDHVARCPARIGQAIEPRDEFEVLAHRKILIKAEALGHIADLALDLFGIAADVVAETGALAAIRGEETAEDTDGRGLARAVGPEEAVDRAALHLHRQIVHDLAAAERFGQALDVDRDAALAIHRLSATGVFGLR